ncbi:hypothetical protein BDF22DRAFT_682594 [Syncephalis plumigaleata]|nr:hypothetical protein BDF22DRAFT_682594 [Syncephalis plumigaleata]
MSFLSFSCRPLLRRYAQRSMSTLSSHTTTVAYRRPTPPDEYDLTTDHRLWRKQKHTVKAASARAARAQCKMMSINNVARPSPEYYQYRLPDRRYEVLQLYRALLREAARFFDPHARDYLRERIRHRFKLYRDWNYPARVNAKIKDARKSLRCLELANHRHDAKANMKILELTYGRRGRRRHELLQPYLQRTTSDGTVDSPMNQMVNLEVEGVPPMSAGLHALLQAQSKRIVLAPDPALSSIRQRNLQKRHIRHILGEVTAPLPSAIHQEISEKAQGTLMNMPVTWQKPGKPSRAIDELPADTQKRIKRKMAKERRRQRRLYRHLLCKVPILVEDHEGSTSGSSSSGIQVKRDEWCADTVPLPTLSEHDCSNMSKEALQKADEYTSKQKKKRYVKHQVQSM